MCVRERERERNQRARARIPNACRLKFYLYREEEQKFSPITKKKRSSLIKKSLACLIRIYFVRYERKTEEEEEEEEEEEDEARLRRLEECVCVCV